MRRALCDVGKELCKAQRMLYSLQKTAKEVENQLVTVSAKLLIVEEMVAEEEEDEEEFEV